MSREKPPKLRDVPRASELRHNFRDRVGRYSPLLDAAGHDSDVRYRSCQRRSSSHESSLVSRPESDAVFINPVLDGKGKDIIGGHRRKKQGDFVASYPLSKLTHYQVVYSLEENWGIEYIRFQYCMKLSFDLRLSDNYTSQSQKVRVLTEAWVDSLVTLSD